MDIKGIGRQHGVGFAYRSSNNNLEQIKMQFDRLHPYKYTDYNCDKFVQADNYTYIKNGNTIRIIKGYSLTVLQKTPTTIQVGSEQLTNVYDFDVFDRTLYYVNADQRSTLKSATVDGNGTFVAGSSITLDGTTINGVVCAQDFVLRGQMSTANVFIKAGDGNELYTVAESIPSLGIGTSRGGISKIISRDDGTLYALSAGPSTSKQVVELNATSHTTVRDGDVTDIFPSNVGFGYISSNHQFAWKDSENISSFGEIGSDVDYGLRIENGSFRVMRGDGIYKPRFKKDYSIDAVQSFRQSANITQISPYDSAANALLISSDSDGRTRYCIYVGAAQQIQNVRVSGAKQHSPAGGVGEDGEAPASKVAER